MSIETEPKLRVLIADDHPLMRQGIRMCLADESTIEVVGEAANGDEAVECALFLHPDVLILDLDMPKCDGFSVVRQLTRKGLSIGVVILTLHTGVDFITEAMELGIRGYIMKTAAVIEITEAVRRVAGGGSYLSETARQAMQVGKVSGELPRELRALSPVELKLLRQVAEGLTSREIAGSLGISGRTVENYRTAICAKLGLSGPNALLRYVLGQKVLINR